MSRENNVPKAVRIDAGYKEVMHHHQAQPEPAVYYPPHGHHGGPNHGMEGTGSHAGMYSMQLSGEGNIERKPPTLQGQRSRATIYGLTQRNFVILCIVALVVLGAAIGGGVGGGLAARQSNGSNALQSTSSAPSSAVPSPTSFTSTSLTPSASACPPVQLRNVNVQPDCPEIDGTRERFGGRYTFQYRCGMDIAGAQYDLIFLASYALEDCVLACVSYNNQRRRNECIGVQFNADMKACALKNETIDAPSAAEPANRRVLAMLEL
ncbi:hypothetical protein C7999DRAFT_34831 [Corynascus novoguineensis]|uniref:Apple domain-containing protein n=1 Tax=Corynascus novoguineensis TaxID=1126955 RepID=A0AAN7HKE8_9PEZI|nr:hypothetical protein C7999DRAFT_34831 [Corynascus novoguineensis]